MIGSDARAMTPRQRVLAALRGEQPDRVPIVDCVDWAPMVALAGLVGLDLPEAEESFAYERLAARLTKALGIDSIWIPMPLGEEPVDQERVRDRYGSVYRLSKHGEPRVEESPVGSLEDLARTFGTTHTGDGRAVLPGASASAIHFAWSGRPAPKIDIRWMAVGRVPASNFPLERLRTSALAITGF